MRIPRIYLDQVLTPDTEVPLDARSAHYLASVLRMKSGMELILFNGSGFEFRGTITALQKKQGMISLQEKSQPNTESPLQTLLAIGISRGERMDYVVQKCTELGVNTIQPVFSEHCEVRLGPDRAEKRRAHWQQVAISASEQSGRVIPPVINPPTTLESWLVQPIAAERKFLLDQAQQQSLSDMSPPGSIALLIGPEGGLAEKEKALALDKGFIGITLGPRTLRTETAPVSALSLLQYLWGA